MTDPLPYFSAEDELAALLLQILLEHCTGDGKMRGLHQPRDPHALYSYDQASNADAMIAMHEQGLINGHSHYDDRTAGWTLSRPSLARVAGYDLMDGGDDIINAVRHGPP